EDLPDIVSVDDFKRLYRFRPFLDINLARIWDEMIQSLERDLDDVVVRVVGDAEQGQPLCLYLVAEAKRNDLDLGSFAFEHLGDAIEKRAPLLLIKLPGGHGKPLVEQGKERMSASSRLS